MRVCKHGRGVKMLCFSRANHASTNLKKFSSSKLDKLLYLPIPSSAETWKIVTKKMWRFFFFRLSCHFKRKSPYFGKHLFAKQADYACKTSWIRLFDW